MPSKSSSIIVAKPVVFVACLIPLAWLTWSLLNDQLGPNPIEELTRQSGEWTLRFLLLTLAMTPLRHALGQAWPLRFRRMLGLYAFFYACAHLLTYVWLDQFFWWAEIGRDIIKRPFITVGMTAFALLVPLAATSTQAMMRRLGGRNWKRLHRLVYIAAVCGVVHFYWLVKADTREPLIYAAILVVLLGARVMRSTLQRRRRAPVAV